MCNFEYDDAADPFIEDKWKMLALVARWLHDIGLRAAWPPVGL